MRLVKAAKASSHAKFYSLSTGYNNIKKRDYELGYVFVIQQVGSA